MAEKTDEELAAEKAAADAKAAEDKAAEEAAAEAKRKADEEADVFDKDRAMATIHKLRDEVKEAKKGSAEAAALKKRVDELEAAQLSEQQKLEKRATDAEAKVGAAEEKLRRANLIVELSRPEHGIVNAAAAAKLLDGVEYSDDGEPTNLTEILPGFLEQNAFLKGEAAKPKPGDLNGGEGGGDKKPPPLTAEELEAAKTLGMTPERYAAMKTVQTPEDWQKLRAAEKAAAGTT
jgi:hypothetical protein